MADGYFSTTLYPFSLGILKIEKKKKNLEKACWLAPIDSYDTPQVPGHSLFSSNVE